jgi:hypothetical protein
VRAFGLLGLSGTLRREPSQVVTVLVAALFLMAGVFDVGPGLLDNLVHLGFGATGLAMSRDPRGARAFLIGGGVAYFLFWQFGTVIDPTLVPLHSDNVAVHLSLVASMFGLAVLSGGRATTPAAVTPEYGYERDVPAEFIRPRPSRNRPPGRGDRRTPPRVAATGRPPSVVSCRI